MTFEVDGINKEGDFFTSTFCGSDVAGKAVKKVKAVDGHLSCDLNGEAVILNMKNGKYYGVNSVGSSIWAAIQVPVSFLEVVSSIMDEYEVDEVTCRESVFNFLELMAKEDLVDFLDE
jgi:hypothetical protein